HCLSELGVDGIDHMPRATEHIAEIVAMTRSLIEKGFAYPSGGDVYFDVAKAPDYGKLSHRDPEALQAGARIEPSTKKRHPGDFALWKGSKPGEPAWESPWGPGRPGWHIECSAMSMRLLGKTFDIHGGGLDLIFPHHENEVAQSESYTGQPFAKYWLHNGLLTKGGKKISKSDPGTIVLASDLLKQHQGDTIRALLLSSHYRRPTDYGPSRLDEIARGLESFSRFFERLERLTGVVFFDLEAPKRQAAFDPGDSALLQEVAGHRRRFLDAMDDDFNTGGAIGELYELVRVLNRFADQSGLETNTAEASQRADFLAGVAVLKELTRILGLFRTAPASPSLEEHDEAHDALTDALKTLNAELGVEPEPSTTDASSPIAPLIDSLTAFRRKVRKEKNFALADQVRNRLADLGVTLEDRPDGTTWKVEPKP
ncbi:MAG: cysteine--tRNA ligase, partial [Isosphaeraceae bacterium]